MGPQSFDCGMGGAHNQLVIAALKHPPRWAVQHILDRFNFLSGNAYELAPKKNVFPCVADRMRRLVLVII